ncbi:Protein FAR-RED IMPAIRED RESPONSE 1 [Bienertia sinuspersici]
MEEGVGDGEGSSNNQMKAKDGEDAVQQKAMECAEGVGGDDAFDDVIVGNECDEVYDEGSDVARGAGLEELHVEQCVDKEDVTDTTNVDGVVTPTVGSVYNNWEQVERMFKAYGKKKAFGVIRGQSAKVTLEHIGHNPEPGQAKLVKQYRMEHFTASMRSRVFNDIDAGVPLANIHDSIARERDGLQNMPIMEKDMRHVVDERRRLKMEGGDAKALLKYAKLKEELLEVVYNSFTKEEFDSRWDEVTSDYGIVNDEWLSGLFVERSMWVHAYMKDQFRAGMRTMQHVESINSFFDKFVTWQTRLCEFGEKYVAAVERRIMQEKEVTEKGHKYTQNLPTRIPLEKYFQRMYTDAKFRAFQRECERLMYCYVKEEIPNKDHICKMFETHGILCRHVIRVLDMNLYEEPPKKYVLRSWRKDIRRKHTLVEVCYHDPTKTENTKRFDKMNIVFYALAFESCGCQRTCDIVLNGLKRISDEVRAYNVAHAKEVGGKTRLGENDSVQSSEAMGSSTQRTAVSGTSHGEQTHAL